MVQPEVENTVENARELSQFYYEDLFGRYREDGEDARLRGSGKRHPGQRPGAYGIHQEGRKIEFLGYLAVLDLAGQPIKSYSALDEQMSRILVEKSKALHKRQQDRDRSSL